MLAAADVGAAHATIRFGTKEVIVNEIKFPVAHLEGVENEIFCLSDVDVRFNPLYTTRRGPHGDAILTSHDYLFF